MQSEVLAPEEGNTFLRPARPPKVETPSPDLSSLTGGVYAVLGHRFTVWASDPHTEQHSGVCPVNTLLTRSRSSTDQSRRTLNFWTYNAALAEKLLWYS